MDKRRLEVKFCIDSLGGINSAVELIGMKDAAYVASLLNDEMESFKFLKDILIHIIWN